jgi:hypothetical protein
MLAIRLRLPITRLWRQCFEFPFCLDLVTTYSWLEFQQVQLLAGKLLIAGAILLDRHLPQTFFEQLYLQLCKLQPLFLDVPSFCSSCSMSAVSAESEEVERVEIATGGHGSLTISIG